EHHVGAISGKVLYLSTLGSFLGAVATAAVLMNFFGVAWTVVINFIAMLSLVVLLQSVTKEKWLATLVVAFCGGLIYWVNVGFEKSAFITTNQYNNYALIKDYIVDDMGPGNILSVNNSASSYLNDKKQGFPYAEFIKNVLFKQLKLQNKEILVIGAGGFSLSAESDFGNHFIYNDIDKQIKPAAKQGFIDRINGDFVAEDARSFLMNKVDQFDVIINDAFSNRYAIPFYLLTQEHIQNIRHALRDNGLAIFNIIANPFFQSRYSRRVDNTIRSVFPSCSATPLRFNTKVTSIIYICQKSSYDADNTIYTDNRNTTTLDFYTQ
ncbi:MAG: fused MFS/spermidine synthase, partial [Coxiellaceae bacterium]|nr:fused MFS/spermidine synthase [Coxiellaceae bacterium]